MAEPAVRAIIVGKPIFRAEAGNAVTLAQGEIHGEFDWDDASSALVGLASTPMLLLEAEKVEPEFLARALLEIAAAVASNGCEVIAAIDANTIDIVTLSLLGDNVQLLCSPALSERVAAITVASLSLNRSSEPFVRDPGGSRQPPLADEVARISRLLADLVAQDALPRTRRPNSEERQISFDIEQPVLTSATTIRLVIRGRACVTAFLAKGCSKTPLGT